MDTEQIINYNCSKCPGIKVCSTAQALDFWYVFNTSMWLSPKSIKSDMSNKPFVNFLPQLALLPAFPVRVDGIANSQALVFLLHYNSRFTGAECWENVICIFTAPYRKFMGEQVLGVQILTSNFLIAVEMNVFVYEWRHMGWWGVGEKGSLGWENSHSSANFIMD